MEDELILGLDIGSSSVRGALFDRRGRMLKSTFVGAERGLDRTRDGGAEIDAKTSMRQVVRVIDSVLEGSPEEKSISRIVSCTFWHSLLGIDAEKRPSTPVLTWADTRSRHLVAKLRDRFDENLLHNRTGARFHSSYWPAKLFWLRTSQPDVWKQTKSWISLGDFLQQQFTGRNETHVSMASGTGMFDQRELVWEKALTKYLRLNKNSLPPIALADEPGFALLPKWQKRWPSLAGGLWRPSVADGVANNIGSGCSGPGRAALMIGTSGAVRMVIKGGPPEKIPEGLWCYRVDEERVILGGAISDGGGLFNWLNRNLRLDVSETSLAREISRRGPYAHGLTVLPFFSGERSTGFNEFATGAIQGLTLAHDAVDILQAAMEAVAFRLSEILDQLNSITQVETIVASGGAITASPVWAQIIADVLGRDLIVSTYHEASLRGAVLLALATTGKIDLAVKKTAKQNLKINFRPECHSVYLKAIRRQMGLIKTLSKTNQ